MKRLIIHIGSPKCGSTYLQRVLLQNKAELKKNGILYPDPPGQHPGNGSVLLDKPVSAIEKYFASHDTVVLSHEDLFSQAAKVQGLRELSQSMGFEIEVVVFLRPFSEFIFGDYSQYLKQNIGEYVKARTAYGGDSFEEFAVRRRSQLAPSAWLKTWSELSTKPIRIDGHKNIQTVLNDLFPEVNFSWQVDKSASNPSLRVVDCEEISAMIALGVPDAKVHDAFKNAFSKVALPDPGRTDDRCRWLEAIFRGQNEKILSTFGFNNLKRV